MNKERFVYTLYIATTPEKLWAALTQGELTRQYWLHENISDWREGSQWHHVATDEKRTVRITGTIIESVPAKSLIFSWREAAFADDPSRETRVTMTIEPVGSMVRFTVIHDDLIPEAEMTGKIRNGWPRVLSSLKSFLETGTPLETWA